MIAVFTDADAIVLAALVAAVGAQMQTWRNQRKAMKETKPNGGSSMRDAIDRIEHKLDVEVVPRIDHAVVVLAEHADRLAVLDSLQKPLEDSKRSPTARTRKTDRKPKEQTP